MRTLAKGGAVLALLTLLCPAILRAEAPSHVMRYLTARDHEARLKLVPVDAHLALSLIHI